MHIVIHMIFYFVRFFSSFFVVVAALAQSSIARTRWARKFFVVVFDNQVLLLYWCENHRNVIFCSHFLHLFFAKYLFIIFLFISLLVRSFAHHTFFSLSSVLPLRFKWYEDTSSQGVRLGTWAFIFGYKCQWTFKCFKCFFLFSSLF